MSIPFFPYKLFFIYIEPIIAVAGSYYIGSQPQAYLADIAPNSAISELSTPVLMTAYQLSNLCLLFALTEHLVLSSTDSLKTWKRFVFALVVADFGHLLSVSPLGLDAYWKFWDWNGMMWGNYGIAYLSTTIKISFLLGIGLSTPATSAKRA